MNAPTAEEIEQLRGELFVLMRAKLSADLEPIICDTNPPGRIGIGVQTTSADVTRCAFMVKLEPDDTAQCILDRVWPHIMKQLAVVRHFHVRQVKS